MNLKDFLDKHGLTEELGPCINKDSKGTLYQTLVAGGVKLEGEKYPLYCTSREKAEDLYLKTLLEFLDGRKEIVWRTRPSTELIYKRSIKRPELWQVWSRLTAY